MNQYLFEDMNPLPQHCVSTHLARRTDPSTSKEAAREAVASGSVDSHKAQILALLRLRPASSRELAAIALKYTSRLSQLKQDGHNIVCRKTRSHATGKVTWVYYLEQEDG